MPPTILAAIIVMSVCIVAGTLVTLLVILGKNKKTTEPQWDDSDKIYH
jgi:uncharacterized membrane protein